jgi:hypothetical protein
MAAARRVPVRSYGSEVPEPTVKELAGWVRERKGTPGDLTSFLLERSLEPQAGVDRPCPGGRIYRARILETFRGIEQDTLAAEPSVDTRPVEEDARWGGSMRKGLWFAVPSPHLLGIRDGFYHDREEFCEGICTCYRQILRAMRDSGAGGHVLVGERVHEEEMEHLVSPKTFFFYPDLAAEDLPQLLEGQSAAAVPRGLLPEVFRLLGEYDLRSLSILDGRGEDLLLALEWLDPDQISLGGYCREQEDCGKYWKDLLERAVIPR